MTPASLQIHIESRDTARAVHLTGRLNTETVAEWEASLRQLLEEGADKLVLDFAGLEYLSSAGLCTILNLGKQAKASGASLLIAVPPGPVRQVIELAGFALLFPVCDSFDQAWSRLLGLAQLTVTASGAVQVIAAAGRIDAERLTEFEALYRRVLDQGASRVVLDFSRLEYLSSAGLRGILDLGKQLKERRGKLAICLNKGPVARILEIAGFQQLFPVRGSLEEAVWDAQ